MAGFDRISLALPVVLPLPDSVRITDAAVVWRFKRAEDTMLAVRRSQGYRARLPGSGHDSQVDDLSYGNKYQHPFLPGFFANTDGGFQHPAPVAAATLSPPVYPQQPGYSLHQVEGIFEPPSGIETPLFVSGNSLTGEEAAALMAANSSWANA